MHGEAERGETGRTVYQFINLLLLLSLIRIEKGIICLAQQQYSQKINDFQGSHKERKEGARLIDYMNNLFLYSRVSCWTIKYDMLRNLF